MSSFVLVHGVCVKGWSWDLVVPHLERAGHRVVAVDLPGDEPAPAFSDYANGVVDSLAGLDDDVVLVGHSTGGLTIPLVTAQRPVREMVFLCAALPVPGESVAERGIEWQVIDPGDWQVDNGDGSFSISADGFRQHVAPDAPDVAEQTIPRLRPQFLTPFLEKCPLELCRRSRGDPSSVSTTASSARNTRGGWGASCSASMRWRCPGVTRRWRAVRKSSRSCY